eukprot:scaffold1943_cov21-Tisochrysis_lutea.AAC.4
MTELENVSLLLGNPSHPKDLGKLGLTTGRCVKQWHRRTAFFKSDLRTCIVRFEKCIGRFGENVHCESCPHVATRDSQDTHTDTFTWTCTCAYSLCTCSRVRALVLPYVADLDESAVTGYKMSQADAHTLTNCRWIDTFLAGAMLLFFGHSRQTEKGQVLGTVGD